MKPKSSQSLGFLALVMIAIVMMTPAFIIVSATLACASRTS
jgi:hypothetical protein